MVAIAKVQFHHQEFVTSLMDKYEMHICSRNIQHKTHIYKIPVIPPSILGLFRQGFFVPVGMYRTFWG